MSLTFIEEEIKAVHREIQILEEWIGLQTEDTIRSQAHKSGAEFFKFFSDRGVPRNRLAARVRKVKLLY